MKVAVLSDLHAKPKALAAALADVEAHDPDELWCLGDLVGYGDRAGARQVVSTARRRFDLTLAGNHDAAATGRADWFLQGIATWLRSTLEGLDEVLDADDYAWLSQLEPQAQRHGIACFHGSATDPLFGFVDEPQSIAQHLADQDSVISLVGHTHLPAAIGLRDGQLLRAEPFHDETIDLGSCKRWILNPGTAGLRQYQRAEDRRSSWLLLDLEANTARWRRIGS